MISSGSGGAGRDLHARPVRDVVNAAVSASALPDSLLQRRVKRSNVPAEWVWTNAREVLEGCRAEDDEEAINMEREADRQDERLEVGLPESLHIFVELYALVGDKL